MTRGRNLLLSSAAVRELDLRSPWDVVSLALLCGADPAVAKAALSAHAHAVLLHAEARKTMKCVLREIKATENEGKQTTKGAGNASAAGSAGGGGTAAAGGLAAGEHPKPARNQGDEPKNKKGKFQK